MVSPGGESAPAQDESAKVRLEFTGSFRAPGEFKLRFHFTEVFAAPWGWASVQHKRSVQVRLKLMFSSAHYDLFGQYFLSVKTPGDIEINQIISFLWGKTRSASGVVFFLR